ncbi:Aminotransferase class I and II [Nesidiocoris tenuis]|uniref:Tyrosine aminotransferase n=1 Tax=Nesidiocoris tenuis TaxID=355587 RepID=A0ABN7AF26_9HEMI|nr:Aminotransferase class I and II [Nesidiocoris tenuis]
MSGRCEWTVKKSKLARKTHNPIRHIIENLDLRPNPEKQMIALSIGDPTIFGNLRAPPTVIDALEDSLSSFRFNGYGPATGFDSAKQAIAEYTSTHTTPVYSEDVVLCSGCSGAIDLAISVLAEAGQNILVPCPGFSIYKTLAEGLDISVKEYKLKPENDWEVDLDDLERAIDDNTAALIITNPSNPCGSVYSDRHLRDIVQVAARHFVPIIADEIYEHLVFKGETFVPIADVSNEVPVLKCSGLTKRFLIPGWRVGWIVVHDRQGILSKEIRGGLQQLATRILGCNTLVQGAIPQILRETPQSFYDETVEFYQNNANIAYELLSVVPGLKPIMPKGAMYMMVCVDMRNFPGIKNGLDFVSQLVCEESVFPLPGECFSYPGYFRIVLSVPEEMLEAACRRISDFCDRHYNRKPILISACPD